MATASTPSKNARTAAHLTFLLWQEALLSWGIPLLLVGTIVVTALLGMFNLIAQATSVATLGCLLILLVGFFLFRAVLTDTVSPRVKILTWAFAFAWICITWIQVYSAVFIGQEIFSGVVSVGGGGLALPLGAQGTLYDLIVEGNFATVATGVAREANYHLTLARDEQKVQDFTGVFSEHWTRQRLGRRGSTTSRRFHNHVLHALRSPGEGTYRLTAVHIDPQLTPSLHITLYRDTYPEKTFWLLNVILLLAAYIGERLPRKKETPLVLVTAVVLTFVLIFRNLGVPPHSYQDLIGALMIAAIIGPLAGWIFRVIADVVSRGLGFSKHRVATVRQERSKGMRH
jgi:hypothetical protein